MALVIGNAGYTAVPALPNAGNDARLIATTLQGLGFTLIGGGAQLDLDRLHLTEAIEALGRSLSGADVALFYYSGHGLQVQGVNWLVPTDANPTRSKDLDFQMVDADLVLRQMDGSGTRLNIILLDACRNNPFSVTGLRSAQGGLAEMRAPEGTLISYATQPGNVAVDGIGANSPYTTALASAMRQPSIDIFRMFNQVGLQVKRATAGAQQPWVSTSPIDGDFYFASLPPTSALNGPDAASMASQEPPVSKDAPIPAAPFVGPPPPAIAPATTANDMVPDQPVLSIPPSQAFVSAAPPPQVALNQPAPSPVAPPAPAPIPPPDLAEGIRAIADAQRCSILETRRTGVEVQVRGLALPGPTWIAFTRQIAKTRGAELVMSDIDMLPPFACDVVEALGSTIRATRIQMNGRMLLPLRSEVTPGSRMTVTVKGTIGEAVIVDLFRSDATVEHLVPLRTSRQGDELQVQLAVPLKGVPGRQLLVVVAGLPPSALGSRPLVEPAARYLGTLSQEMAGNTAAQADIAPIVVQAAAPPVVALPTKLAAPTPHTSQCPRIIERAQLGEPLSESDRALLKNCH